MGTSKFESRVGKIPASGKVIFDFITNMTNFKQFVPLKTIENWEADKESCSFELSPVGNVKLEIVEKEPFKTVKYRGDGLNNTESYLWVQLKEIESNDTRVKLTIKAEINPVIKPMVAKPIGDFLEKLVSGLESIEDWDNVKM